MLTSSFAEFAGQADYSLLNTLQPDPQATADGRDHRPRQVRSGHYVPVTATPLPDPKYVAHSTALFAELDRKSTRLNSSHVSESRMPSSA